MAAGQNNGKQTDIIISDFDCNSASKFSKAWTEDLLSKIALFIIITHEIAINEYQLLPDMHV